MKVSYYNFTFDFPKDDSKHIIYNSRTNALALLDEPQHKKYMDFLNLSLPFEDEEFIKQLKYGGYLIEDDYNELDELKFKLYCSRYSTDILGLSIATTSKCNFGCSYCYEKNSEKFPPMNAVVQEEIVKLVKEQSKRLSNLSVCWYGGEPLMAFDVIENLSLKFLEICEENNITYSSSIITNGYYLTPDIYKSLMPFNVESIQVTLDGYGNEHDKRRPLLNGGGTFETILNNLCSLKEQYNSNCKIKIRINVDKRNLDGVDKLMNVFKEKGLLEYVSPYIAKVANHNETVNSSVCYNTEDFSDLTSDFVNKYFKNGFKSMYPTLVLSYCTADSLNGYVIDPNGNLFKCWEDIGISEKCIGNIVDKTYNKDTLFNYILYSAPDDQKCKICKYLPICMGGCPKIRNLTGDERCSSAKFKLEYYLQQFVSEINN